MDRALTRIAVVRQLDHPTRLRYPAGALKSHMTCPAISLGFLLRAIPGRMQSVTITRDQVSKHIEALGRRILAIEDYPLDEDRLKKWRTDVDTIRADIDRLEFILKKLPSKITSESLPR
jgi:hypothetical protein